MNVSALTNFIVGQLQKQMRKFSIQLQFEKVLKKEKKFWGKEFVCLFTDNELEKQTIFSSQWFLTILVSLIMKDHFMFLFWKRFRTPGLKKIPLSKTLNGWLRATCVPFDIVFTKIVFKCHWWLYIYNITIRMLKWNKRFLFNIVCQKRKFSCRLSFLFRIYFQI